jgi:hypothetical protein
LLIEGVRPLFQQSRANSGDVTEFCKKSSEMVKTGLDG